MLEVDSSLTIPHGRNYIAFSLLLSRVDLSPEPRNKNIWHFWGGWWPAAGNCSCECLTEWRGVQHYRAASLEWAHLCGCPWQWVWPCQAIRPVPYHRLLDFGSRWVKWELKHTHNGSAYSRSKELPGIHIPLELPLLSVFVPPIISLKKW